MLENEYWDFKEKSYGDFAHQKIPLLHKAITDFQRFEKSITARRSSTTWPTHKSLSCLKNFQSGLCINSTRRFFHHPPAPDFWHPSTPTYCVCPSACICIYFTFSFWSPLWFIDYCRSHTPINENYANNKTNHTAMPPLFCVAISGSLSSRVSCFTI